MELGGGLLKAALGGRRRFHFTDNEQTVLLVLGALAVGAWVVTHRLGWFQTKK